MIWYDNWCKFDSFGVLFDVLLIGGGLYGGDIYLLLIEFVLDVFVEYVCGIWFKMFEICFVIVDVWVKDLLLYMFDVWCDWGVIEVWWLWL